MQASLYLSKLHTCAETAVCRLRQSRSHQTLRPVLARCLLPARQHLCNSITGDWCALSSDAECFMDVSLVAERALLCRGGLGGPFPQ